MTSRSVVIALRPQWANAIATGEKHLEFRRVWSRQAAPYCAYLYVTSPVSALQALVTVAAIHEVRRDNIESLKARFPFPNTPSRVMHYLGVCGIALEVRDYRRLKPVIPLRELRELGFSPPQNFAYLDSYPGVVAALKNEIFEETLAPNPPSRQNETNEFSD